MSLFNPYKVDGVIYKTPREAQAAKQAKSERQIEQKKGLKGVIGAHLLRTVQRKGVNHFIDPDSN